MTVIRARAFGGPTQHLALVHPFYGAKSVLGAGVPIGIDMMTRQLVYFDPWYLKSIGAIHSAQGLFIADKGIGKSATMKILTVRLGMLSAGYQAMRMSVNDHKNEGEQMEYTPLIETIGAKVFTMANMRVNPLDHHLCPKLSNLIDMASMLCGFSSGQLDVIAKTALRVAVYRMYRMPKELWSLSLLHAIVRSMTLDDVDAYFRESSRILSEEQHERLKQLRLDALSNQYAEVESREFSIDQQDVIHAAARVYHMLDDLVSGEDANLFGTSNGLYEMYTQRANGKNWSGLTARGETIMRTLDAKIKSYAIENRDYRLIAHLELDDERHRSIGNLANARASAYFSKVARAVPTCNISATHRLSDLRKGGFGSEAYNLGDSIINDMGFVMIGRQRNSKAIIDELHEKYRLTAVQRDYLPALPPYCFMFKLGEEFEPTFVRIFATPKELSIIQTDSANESMLSRPDVMSPDDLQQYAAANGVRFLGMAA